MKASKLIFLTSMSLACAACASFGGNVKGNFVCEAPGGICAPTSAIDDQAISLMESGSNGVRATADEGQLHSANALRIVLPARQDRFGRWRDQSVVYAEPEIAAGSEVGAGGSAGGVPQRLSLAELAAGAPALKSVSRRMNAEAERPAEGGSAIDRIKADVRSIVGSAEQPSASPQLGSEPVALDEEVSHKSASASAAVGVVVAPLFVPGTGEDD